MKTINVYILLIIVSLLFIQCNSKKIDASLSFVSFEYEMPTKSSRFPQKYPILAKCKYIISVFNTTTDILKVKDMMFYETINNHRELMMIDTAFNRLGIRPGDSLWIGVYSNKTYKITNTTIDYKSFLDSKYCIDNKSIKLQFEFEDQLTKIDLNGNVRIHHNLIDPYTKKFIHIPSVFWLGMKDSRLDTNAINYINLKKRSSNTSKMLIIN